MKHYFLDKEQKGSFIKNYKLIKAADEQTTVFEITAMDGSSNDSNVYHEELEELLKKTMNDQALKMISEYDYYLNYKSKSIYQMMLVRLQLIQIEKAKIYLEIKEKLQRILKDDLFISKRNKGKIIDDYININNYDNLSLHTLRKLKEYLDSEVSIMDDNICYSSNNGGLSHHK